ncbi:mitogen-activated protein kinase kinase, putative [Entamoeba invadens IP1]|uniref:Mitogen-activated protein kinase kinase, putative n=1 Tax=Entamoeba invadens IP1 TaxID=370355 RepID=A0A0A1U1C6_ENTIV|nr:mitogen-activated protein kinase kinase, putative [Entamoeba invadens IP1]ELP87830.1 mitogen-activated protein kinase kinase, putative [Entamoeba invadens IP1]|eukprot:XP_004254601.1 mitogen-activated protein kinase kinase, putative [Entamoeba invadens IP1]
MESQSSVRRSLLISTEDRFTQYSLLLFKLIERIKTHAIELSRKLFLSDKDFEITKGLVECMTKIESPFFEGILNYQTGFDETTNEETILITCEIDRLVLDYFNSAISIDAVRYFSSDIQTLLDTVLALRKSLSDNLKTPILFLFTEMSVSIQSDPSSPIPQLKLSVLGFILPYVIDSMKHLDGISPYIPPDLQNKTVTKKDVTKLEVPSFLVLLHKLLFQKNPAVNYKQMTSMAFGDITTDVAPPIQFLQKLFKKKPSFPKILEMMRKNDFFKQCWQFKYIQPIPIESMFSVFDMSSVKILGKGAFGCVFSASHVGNYYAIKELSLADVALKEVRTMVLCHHPNIVTLFQFYTSKMSVRSLFNTLEPLKSELYYYVVMECSAYGSLYNFMSMNKSGVSLEYIQQFMNDINSAMEYLIFTRQIIHRDLKTQNVLVFQDQTKKIGLTLKLCDFGSSRLIGDNIFDTFFVGTGHTNQPEISHGKIYNEKCDLFSIGVMLYEMITGIMLNVKKDPSVPIQNYYTFYQQKLLELMNNRSNFVAGKQQNFEILVDLMRGLFVDQTQRPTWEQYLQHPFFKIIFV